MIATNDMQLKMDEAQALVDAYVTAVFDETFFANNGKAIEDGWHFMVKCQRADMDRKLAVGGIRVSASGVEELSADRIRDMREIGEIQAAKEQGELARDAEGFVLRRQARIKASCWLSDNIGMKIGAEGGVFVNQDSPIWRFSVHYYFSQKLSPVLDVINVDAKTGDIHPLTQEQIQIIIGGVTSVRGAVEHLPISNQNGLNGSVLRAA